MRMPRLQYIMLGSERQEDLESTRPDLFKLIMRRDIRRLQKPLGMYAILYRLLTQLILTLTTWREGREEGEGRKGGERGRGREGERGERERERREKAGERETEEKERE